VLAYLEGAPRSLAFSNMGTVDYFSRQSKPALECGPAPFRGPSGHQSRSQYYDVLNHFFFDGVRVRRCARFKRIGDKQGWGAPEYREGLELDRSRFLNDWKLSQAGARLAELAADGCEILSYKKHPAPGDMVTYLLVSWPTNAELERNRSARVLSKQPKQTPLPRAATPFQHTQPSHTAESGCESPAVTRQERIARFEREFRPAAVVPVPTTDSLPLFAGVRE
jgi:hypothetical protein